MPIHAGEGAIHAIKWRKTLIAWANRIGVKIYDCVSGQRITSINRPPNSPHPELYQCNLCWENDSTLLIGWADSIKIGQIKVIFIPPSLPPPLLFLLLSLLPLCSFPCLSLSLFPISPSFSCLSLPYLPLFAFAFPLFYLLGDFPFF